MVVGAIEVAPARSGPRGVFYGWVVVAAAFTVLFVGYGIQFSFGVMIPAITEDLGWSRARLTLPYTVYVFLYSSLSSVSGMATDRFGPRRVVAVGGVLLGLGWASFGLATASWHVYLGLGVVGALGMSASWVPCNATVVRWFVRRRGTAVGVASAGGSAGNLVVPPLVGMAIAAIGWRPTLYLLGAGATIGLLGASRFFVRDPETLGLVPDGDPAPPPSAATDTAPSGPAYTLAEARRLPVFWVVYGIFTLTWLVVFVPFVHLAAFGGDLGLSDRSAALVLSSIGLGGMSGRLLAGAISDRIGRKPSLVLMLSLQILSFVAMAAAAAGWQLYPAALVFGFGYGGAVSLFPALVGDVFGRLHAGAIVGTLFAASGSLGAVGPFAAAYLFDVTGSYRIAFVISACSNLGALALVALLRTPNAEVAPRGGAGGDGSDRAAPGAGGSLSGLAIGSPDGAS